jgi:hypothetical protein
MIIGRHGVRAIEALHVPDAVVIAVKMKRKHGQDATQLASWRWLIEQAKEDIEPRILQQRVTPAIPSCSYYLKPEDGPRLELSLYVFNGSPWLLHVERLEGHITFGGIALRLQPELIGNRDIGHGLAGSITVKQWLDADQVDLLRQKVEQINDDQLILDLHNLKITITGNPRAAAGIEPVEYVIPLAAGYLLDTQRVFRR